MDASMSIRFANVQGRSAVVVGDGVIDVAERSSGRFSSDPTAALREWAALADWARGLRVGDAKAPLRPELLGPPVPRPAKVFAIGVNYRGHAAEAGMDIPKTPMVFTKFPNCLAGPHADVVLGSAFGGWEVELVVVMGRGGRGVPERPAARGGAGPCGGAGVPGPPPRVR